MKIPTVDYKTPEERPVAQNYENFNTEDGTSALQRGVGQLAQGVEDIQTVNAARAAKAKEKADASAADSLMAQAQAYTVDKLHGYDKPGTDAGSVTEGQEAVLWKDPGEHVPGYLDTMGHEAYQQSGALTEDLQKKYDSLLSTAANDTQRALVTKRLLALKLTVHQQVAEHEGTQLRVAEVAASRALQDSTVRQAGGMWNQQAELEPFIKDTLASIKRTVLPEEYQAKADAFLGDVSKARINRYVAQGDLEGAKAQAKLDSKVLGKDGPIIIKELNARTAHSEAAAYVDTVAEKLRKKNPDGYVTEQQLRESVKMEDIPEIARDQALAYIERKVRIEEGRLKDDIGFHENEAEGADVQGKFIPENTMEFLQKYDAKFLRVRRDRLESQARARRTEARGSAREISDARWRQKQIDQQYAQRLRYEMAIDPSVDPTKVMQDFVIEVSTEDTPVHVSAPAVEKGRADVAVYQQQKGEKGDKALASAESSQASLFRKVIAAQYAQKGVVPDQAALAERVGKALKDADERTAEKGGKPLSQSEVADIVHDMLIANPVEEPRTGIMGAIFGGTTTVKKRVIDTLPAPAPKKAAPAKTVTGYAVSGDKKQRRPRYSDGSLGPPETNPASSKVK